MFKMAGSGVTFQVISSTPTFLLAAWLCLHLVRACHIEERSFDFSPEGYNTYVVHHNVCVDNTTIQTSLPQRTPPGSQILIRRCCGCRALAFERELNLNTVWPRLQHVFYFTDIRECQCISCDFEAFPHLRYLVQLKH